MSSSAARSADRGGAAGGGVLERINVAALTNSLKSRFAAVGATPSALASHFPYLAAGTVAQRNTLAVAIYGLWFRVELCITACFPICWPFRKQLFVRGDMQGTFVCRASSVSAIKKEAQRSFLVAGSRIELETSGL